MAESRSIKEQYADIGPLLDNIAFDLTSLQLALREADCDNLDVLESMERIFGDLWQIDRELQIAYRENPKSNYFFNMSSLLSNTIGEARRNLRDAIRKMADTS